MGPMADTGPSPAPRFDPSCFNDPVALRTDWSPICSQAVYNPQMRTLAQTGPQRMEFRPSQPEDGEREFRPQPHTVLVAAGLRDDEEKPDRRVSDTNGSRDSVWRARASKMFRLGDFMGWIGKREALPSFSPEQEGISHKITA